MPKDPRTGTWISQAVYDALFGSAYQLGSPRVSAAASQAANATREISVGGRVMSIAEAARQRKASLFYSGATVSATSVPAPERAVQQGPSFAPTRMSYSVPATPTFYAYPHRPYLGPNTSSMGAFGPSRFATGINATQTPLGSGAFGPMKPVLPPNIPNLPPPGAYGAGGGASGRGVGGVNLMRSIGMTGLHVGAAYTIFRVIEGLGSAADEAKEFSGYLARIKNTAESQGHGYAGAAHDISGMMRMFGLPGEGSAIATQRLLGMGVRPLEMPEALNRIGVLTTATGGKPEELARSVSGLTRSMGKGPESFRDIGETVYRLSSQIGGGQPAEALRDALSELNSIAKEVGMSLEELGAGLVHGATHGLSAEESKAGLMTLLSQIGNPSKEQQEIARRYNVPFNRSTFTQEGLGGFLQAYTHVPSEMRGELVHGRWAQRYVAAAAGDVRGYQGQLSRLQSPGYLQEEASSIFLRSLEGRHARASQQLAVNARPIGNITSSLGLTFKNALSFAVGMMTHPVQTITQDTLFGGQGNLPLQETEGPGFSGRMSRALSLSPRLARFQAEIESKKRQLPYQQMKDLMEERIESHRAILTERSSIEGVNLVRIEEENTRHEDMMKAISGKIGGLGALTDPFGFAVGQGRLAIEQTRHRAELGNILNAGMPSFRAATFGEIESPYQGQGTTIGGVGNAEPSLSSLIKALDDLRIAIDRERL